MNDHVTDNDRHLVSERFRGEAQIRAAFPRMDTGRRRSLFDDYYNLADKIAGFPGGLTPERQRVRENLFDFAYRLSDIACDYLERLRHRVPQYWPAYGAALARARQSGRVPEPINGVHVAVALRFQYRRAAPGACIVVEATPDFERFDYRFMAGLHVEILAVRADLDFADWLARRMAADGLLKITLRHLDNPTALVETLYDGGRPWRM
jgi:hypothetical protein